MRQTWALSCPNTTCLNAASVVTRLISPKHTPAAEVGKLLFGVVPSNSTRMCTFRTRTCIEW